MKKTLLCIAFFLALALIAQLPTPTSGSGSGGGTWGSITGTLSDQTDLQTALNAAGGLVLLKTLTASSSASLDFTTRTDGGALIQSDFDEYLVEISNLLPASDNTAPLLRVSTDGGSTYVSSGTYQWIHGYNSGAGTSQRSGASATSVQLGGTAGNGSGTFTFNGHYRLYNPGGGVAYTNIQGEYARTQGGTGTDAMEAGRCYGVYQATTAVNAFQVFMSSGNIASGTIRVYGIAKS